MYQEYTVNARKLERQFKREISKKGYFLTARGCANRLVEYGKSTLWIKTEKGNEPIEMKRSAIRKAISFFFFKRTAIIADFQAFSSFTSALFAIIKHCFRDKTKLLTLKHGLFRLSLLGTRFFASGMEKSPGIIELYKKLNGKYVLFNYKSIIESPNCLEFLEKYHLYCIVDSGAFSFFNENKKSKKYECQQQLLFEDEDLNDMMLEGYAQFINTHKTNKRILGFFPLDCIGDPVRTRENYKRLKELTDATIYPVWQITDSYEELDNLVSTEPEMVGLGGFVPFLSRNKSYIKEVLQEITKRHPNMPFHALGIADEMLQEFGIFSADSTAYLNARRWNDRRVYLPNGERIEAPAEMTTVDIIKDNLLHLIGLEDLNKNIQLTLADFSAGA